MEQEDLIIVHPVKVNIFAGKVREDASAGLKVSLMINMGKLKDTDFDAIHLGHNTKAIAER